MITSKILPPEPTPTPERVTSPSWGLLSTTNQYLRTFRSRRRKNCQRTSTSAPSCPSKIIVSRPETKQQDMAQQWPLTRALGPRKNSRERYLINRSRQIHFIRRWGTWEQSTAIHSRNNPLSPIYRSSLIQIWRNSSTSTLCSPWDRLRAESRNIRRLVLSLYVDSADRTSSQSLTLTLSWRVTNQRSTRSPLGSSQPYPRWRSLNKTTSETSTRLRSSVICANK